MGELGDLRQGQEPSLPVCKVRTIAAHLTGREEVTSELKDLAEFRRLRIEWSRG